MVVKGELYDARKPRDSNLLHGDGSFTTVTVKSIKYTARKGKRFDEVRPDSSALGR